MVKLLRAGVRRYLRSVIWWLSMAASIICGTLFGDMTSRESYAEAYPLLYLHVIFACLIALSVGREVSERVIRNKIVAGHTKKSVLLSELILAVSACLLLTVLFLIPMGMLTVEVYSSVPLGVRMTVLAGIMLASTVCSVIDVLICMLIHNRAVSAVVCLILVIGMSLAGTELYTALSQKEFVRDPVFTYNDKTGALDVTMKQERNPRYVDGDQRRVYRFIINCIPYGQAEEYAVIVSDYMQKDLPIDDEQNADLSYNAYYSAGFMIVLVTVGLLAFRRRDLK